MLPGRIPARHVVSSNFIKISAHEPNLISQACNIYADYIAFGRKVLSVFPACCKR